VAVAAYKTEKAKTTNGKPSGKKSGLSPWVAAHRAGLQKR
jgi:hypothetical protein